MPRAGESFRKPRNLSLQGPTLVGPNEISGRTSDKNGVPVSIVLNNTIQCHPYDIEDGPWPHPWCLSPLSGLDNHDPSHTSLGRQVRYSEQAALLVPRLYCTVQYIGSQVTLACASRLCNVPAGAEGFDPFVLYDTEGRVTTSAR
jgi:hypothetical protein